jgi:hypothetical protein
MNRVYIHYGADHYDDSKFKPISNYNSLINKPKGGFWASPVNTNWGWKEWCESEEFYTDRLKIYFKFTLVNGSKVFHIRTPKDVPKLPFGKKPESELGWMDWYYNWEKIAEKYDAVELHLSNNYMYFHDVFYSWDVDSIVILKPGIVREIK